MRENLTREEFKRRFPKQYQQLLEISLDEPGEISSYWVEDDGTTPGFTVEERNTVMNIWNQDLECFLEYAPEEIN